MLKLTTLIITIGFTLVVILGAILAFVLAIGSANDNEYGYAVAFTVTLIVLSTAWLAGGAGMVLKTLQHIELGTPLDHKSKDDIEMVDLNMKCPTCGNSDLVAMNVGNGIGMICCSRKMCADFGKPINLIAKEAK